MIVIENKGKKLVFKNWSNTEKKTKKKPPSNDSGLN